MLYHQLSTRKKDTRCWMLFCWDVNVWQPECEPLDATLDTEEPDNLPLHLVLPSECVCVFNLWPNRCQHIGCSGTVADRRPLPNNHRSLVLSWWPASHLCGPWVERVTPSRLGFSHWHGSVPVPAPNFQPAGAFTPETILFRTRKVGSALWTPCVSYLGCEDEQGWRRRKQRLYTF